MRLVRYPQIKLYRVKNYDQQNQFKRLRSVSKEISQYI